MGSRRGHGEGSIFKRSDGRWIGSVDLGWIDGRRRRRHVSGDTQKEVAERLAEARALHERGALPAGRPPTLGQFMTAWLAGLTLEASTIRGYEQVARCHLLPTLGRTRIDKLTPIDVDRLLREKAKGGLSPQSVATIRAVLRSALSYAVRKGMLGDNVVKRSEPVKVREYQATFLTREQGIALLEAARGDRLEALFVLAATTGMRQGEILGLLWRNVDLDKREVRVATQLARAKDRGQFVIKQEPKWGSKRTVTLPEMTLRALRAHKIRQNEERLSAGKVWKDHGLVFASEIGTPISASNLLRRSFKPLLERAGLPPMRFHDVRHSAATIALAAGVPLRVVMATLGHTQVRTTLRYAHVARELALEAAAAMDRALGG